MAIDLVLILVLLCSMRVSASDGNDTNIREEFVKVTEMETTTVDANDTLTLDIGDVQGDFESNRTFWLPSESQIDGQTREEGKEADSKTTEIAVTEMAATQITPNETSETVLGDKLDDGDVLPTNDAVDEQEMISLHRDNCDLELGVNVAEDRRIRLSYDGLRTGMTGSCQTTLRGRRDTLLAVIVRNVHLNVGNSTSQTLDVVTRTSGFNYTLKRYDGREEHYPVILTESPDVFLVLHYNNTQPELKATGFDLEVFNYYRNENKIDSNAQSDTGHGYGTTIRGIDDIYITTALPYAVQGNYRWTQIYT